MDPGLDDLAQSARLFTDNVSGYQTLPTATVLRPPTPIAPEDDPRTEIALQRVHNAALLAPAIRAAGRRSNNVIDLRRDHVGPNTGTGS